MEGVAAGDFFLAGAGVFVGPGVFEGFFAAAALLKRSVGAVAVVAVAVSLFFFKKSKDKKGAAALSSLEFGSVVGVFSGAAAALSVDELLARVQSSPQMLGADLADEVSAEQEYVVPAVGERRFTVAAVDLGIKGATPRHMADRGIEVHVLPSTTTPERMLEVGVDGVFFSNGPGDPATADHAVALVSAALEARRPLFGICFGNQVLGRALGFGTYKLRYGHRGINVPVLDRLTGTVEITAQNHGFAVDAPLDAVSDTPFGRVEVSHVCLNDDVVEGLRCLDVPAFSVQYHPEAAAGPHDSAYLFDRFCDLMEASHAAS